MDRFFLIQSGFWTNFITYRANSDCALYAGGNGSPYGSFTMATFVSKTVSDIDTHQEIESILSVSRRPRWPRQVQSRLSHVIVIGVITLNFANVNTALSTVPEEGRDLGVCCIRQSQNPKSNNLYANPYSIYEKGMHIKLTAYNIFDRLSREY
jgi:hypothetical protein